MVKYSSQKYWQSMNGEEYCQKVGDVDNAQCCMRVRIRKTASTVCIERNQFHVSISTYLSRSLVPRAAGRWTFRQLAAFPLCHTPMRDKMPLSHAFYASKFVRTLHTEIPSITHSKQRICCQTIRALAGVKISPSRVQWLQHH